MGFARNLLLVPPLTPFGIVPWWILKSREEKEKLRAAFKDAASYHPPNIHGSQDWATVEMLRAAGRLKPEGCLLGYTLDLKHEIFSGTKFPHLLSMGGTSKGKTSGALISAILHDSLRRTSIIAPDIAAELACTTGHFRQTCGKSIIIDPHRMFPNHLRGLTRGFYNPMGLHWLHPNDPYFAARAAKLASLCVTKVEGRDQYWYLSGRLALQAVIMAERKYGNPANATLPHVARIVCDDLCRYAQYMMRKAADPAIRTLLMRWANPRAASGDIRSLSEVIENLRTEIAFLLDPGIAETLSRSTFTFAQAKREVLSVYFLLAHEVLDGALAKFFRLMSGCALAETMRQDSSGSVRTVFVLDELYMLDLPELPKLYAGARKFNVAIWGLLQDLGELKEMHPKTFETVLGNANQQWIAAGDLEGSEYCSRMLGETEVYGYSKSLNYDQSAFNIKPFAGNLPDDEVRFSAVTERQLAQLKVTQNYSQQRRRLQLSQEVRALAPDLQILFLDGVPAPVLAKRLPYFQTAAKRRARPNPYYRGK